MKSHHYTIILLLYFNNFLFGQSEQSPKSSLLSSEAPSLRFENLGLKDGLLQSSAHVITQDSKGYIWIATQGGLHKYNGYEFEVFTEVPFDSTSLTDSWVWASTEAQNGDILVTTQNGGLNRLDPETGRSIHYINVPDDSTSISSNRTFYPFEDSKGNLWVSTWSGGLNRMKAGEEGIFKRFLHDPNDSTSITSDWTFFINEDNQGHIWVGSSNGISRINIETEEIRRYLYNPNFNPSQTIDNTNNQYIPPGENGIIWIATGYGLVRLNTENGKYKRYLIEENNRQNRNELFDIKPDPDNPSILWVGGPGAGLLRFDMQTEKFTAYRNNPMDEYSISSNDVSTLLLDRSGMMWVGTFSDGVDVFNPNSVDYLHIGYDEEQPDNSLPPGVVWGIYEDKLGSLWVGTDDPGTGKVLTEFNGKTQEIIQYRPDNTKQNTLTDGIYRSFAEDERGGFWVASDRGLNKLDRSTGQVERFLQSTFNKNIIFVICPDKNDPDYLWIAHGNGLDRFNTITTSFSNVRLSSDSTSTDPLVFGMLQDSEGILWLGTSQGLYKVDHDLKTELVSSYNPKDTTQINDRRVISLYEQENNTDIIWVATFNGGLNKYDKKAGIVTHYTKKEGLPDNTIYGILEDKNETLWFSTNYGICNFNPATEEVKNYGLDDGLSALEYNQNAYFKGNDGTIYFGHGNGFTAFDPEKLNINTIAPQVVLEDIKLFKKSLIVEDGSPLTQNLSETEEITFDHDQNEITLEFAGLHFANPKKNQYQFILEGFDEQWVNSGTLRSASYTNLPSGEYTFRVKASNSDGVWIQNDTALKINVLPPWYRTWWAYLLFAAILGILVFLVDRIQRYRISQQEKERSALREAELRAEAENKRRADTEKLSRIGKTITSSLSIDTILDTVYENVNALMDAAVFSVGIHNPEKNALDFPAIKENGVTLDPYSNYLDEDHWLSVVCFLEKREIIIGDFLNEYSYYLKSKTKPLVGETPNSIIYLPLSQNGKVIGVITTQSFAKNAYSEYHVNILRNLANYAAIALDNASTYRKLSATQQQLVYSEKMASLGELTAGIAHEIQNPLNFVNNFSELNNELLDDLQDAISKNDQEEIDAIYADLRENESKINHHGKRAEEIVKSMLQHSRGGDGEKEPTDINALADEYLRLAYHGLRAKDKLFNAEFKADLDPKLSDVNIVPQDIGRVLLNLINNSFQAVSEKARANSNGYAPVVEVSTRKKHGNVEIVVKDNGPGIPQEIQDKIFQPFFTTKPTGEGTGLGLSMSFDIITKGHNGNIELQTKEGETKFIITLPTR